MFRMIGGLLLFGMLAVPYTSEAQECGELPENYCGYVISAASTWNDLFGRSVRIDSWDYLGSETMSVGSLIDMMDESPSLADIDSEGNVSIISTTALDRLHDAEQ